MPATITLEIPDVIYQRLVNTANATGRSLEEIVLHVLKVGSPPNWDDIPDEFKADVATLDRLEDEALWQIARAKKPASELTRYDELLDRNQVSELSQAEKLELIELRSQTDRFMLRKAQAAALLQWRGHRVPNS